MKHLLTYKLFEGKGNKIRTDVDMYYAGDKNQIFVFLVKNGEAVGGLYCGFPPSTGENHWAVMKVGINKEKFGKQGYGELLYLIAMALSKNGISPHRRKDSSRIDSQNVWKRLSDNSNVKQIELDIKLYDNNIILDSKYILVNDELKKQLIDNTEKVSNDAFDKTNKMIKDAWDIVKKHMDNENDN